MIARGEVLERMTLVRSGHLELDALFQDGASTIARTEPVVLAGPHPRLGGNMDSPVLAEIVWALARAGHPTLRFNWRGVGASQGETRIPPLPAVDPVSLDDELADLSAAVDQQIGQLGARTAAVVGYSFGALVAAHLALTHRAVERLVLVSPTIRALPVAAVDLAHAGVWCTIITGEADTHAPADEVRRWGGLGVRIIPAATHTYQRGLSQLGALVRDALGGPAE